MRISPTCRRHAARSASMASSRLWKEQNKRRSERPPTSARTVSTSIAVGEKREVFFFSMAMMRVSGIAICVSCAKTREKKQMWCWVR
jgi:hypothetical protein